MKHPFTHKPQVNETFFYLGRRRVINVKRHPNFVEVLYRPEEQVDARPDSFQLSHIEWNALPDAPRYKEKQPPALTRDSKALMHSIVNSEAFKKAVREEVERALNSTTTKIEAYPPGADIKSTVNATGLGLQRPSEIAATLFSLDVKLTDAQKQIIDTAENLGGWSKESVFFGASTDCKNFYKDAPPARQAEIDAMLKPKFVFGDIVRVCDFSTLPAQKLAGFDLEILDVGPDGGHRMYLVKCLGKTNGPSGRLPESFICLANATSQETPPAERTEGDDLMDFFK